jgi:hypothetical protein
MLRVKGGFKMRRLIVILMAFGLILGACSADPTTSEEYLDLEQELTTAQGQIDDLETQLASVTAERDELMAEPDVPAEVLAIPDEWLEANNRGDGSVVDLYATNGYHVYGYERIPRDELVDHFAESAAADHEWVTDPYVVADEGDGRYVVVRGMRIDFGGASYTSALGFEIEETADGTPEIVHTQWMDTH